MKKPAVQRTPQPPNAVAKRCPLIRSRLGENARLPRLKGRTLATFFAFGAGLMTAVALVGS